MSIIDRDQKKVEAFARQMMDILNKAALSLMMSIGHQTGLFDIMADLPPSTSKQIAVAAGLNERYVREWLGALVTGRIIDYEPSSQSYCLSPEHAVWLTWAAGTDNIASQNQIIPILAAAEQEIVQCFRLGGGVPYSSYPRMQDLIADGTRAKHDESLIDKVLPLIPALAERMQDGIEVADFGCGSGYAINLLASAFPRSRFIGYDISSEDIQTGRREAERMGLSNARFEAKDAEALKMSKKFDLITSFDAIHIQAQPRIVLRRIANALRCDGTFLMVDFAASSRVEENLDHPLGSFINTFSCMHCMTVSLAQDGEGLGAVWGEENTRQMLTEAGFTHIELKRIASDIFHNYYIASFGQP